MWCMFGLKNSSAQALWWLAILANSYLSLERFIDGFCHWSINFDRLEGDSYNSILIIVDWLTKIVYYKPVKISIDAPGLAEVIINIVVRYNGLPDSIVTNRGSLFTSKFWSSLCYFLDIKRRLSITFYPQTNGQTESRNSTIEAYLRAFINF